MRDEERSGLVPVPAPRKGAQELVAYTPGRAGPPPDDEIDLREIWRIIRMHRWTILSVFGVVVTSTIVATLLMRPVYRGTALLEIQAERARFGLPAVSAPAPIDPRHRIGTQAHIIRSESVADAAIARLGLADDPEATGELTQPGFLGSLGEMFATVALAVFPSAGRPESHLEHELLGGFLERMDVEPVRDSALVQVSFESFDPELAADAANAIVREYVRLGSSRRFEAASVTKDFLTTEIKKVQSRLEMSERNLNAFARRENIVDVDGKADLLTTRVSELSEELTRAVGERIMAESLQRQLGRGRAGELVSVLESELVTTLKEKQARHLADYGRLSRIYKKEYPKLVQLRAELDEVEAEIRREIGRLAASIETDYDRALDREELLRRELEQEKAALLDLKDRAIQFHILRREWETNRELYTALLEQLHEVGVAAGTDVERVTTVDPARVPIEPHRPRLGVNVAVASSSGLLLGVLLAFLLAYLDDVVRTPDVLENVTGLASFGAIPRADEADPAERITETHGWCPTSEALRSVRTHLLLSSGGTGARLFQITSASLGEGKTTTAANLAILLAQPGPRVLLIDGDLRRGRVGSIFGVSGTPGLAEVLQGSQGVEPRSTAIRNLYVLPAGDPVDDPTELLGSVNMQVLVESVGELYDYVVIDSPPVLGLADASLISTRVEGVLMVASAEETRKDALALAVKRLRLVGAPLLAGVLNLADSSRGDGDYYGGDYSSPAGEGSRPGLGTEAT